MSRLPTISLITNWTVDYFEDGAATLYEFMNTELVESLAVWAFDKRRSEGWLAWLQKSFDLPVMNHIACLNYVLEIDQMPYGAALVINGREFGMVRAPFSMDVTDFIALEDNRIAFRVPPNTAGSFQGIRLVAVPCE
jgi:hypothetical protein